MAQKHSRAAFAVGLFVLALGITAVVSLVVVGQSEGTWNPKTTVFVDFKTITGLRKGSPVQLAGVEIGTVSDVQFAEVTYSCHYGSEDFGRYGSDRTDDCDPFLFCGKQGVCAELEPWASKGQHPPCLTSAECGVDEICVSRTFRRRYPRVEWVGQQGVCARSMTDLRRVRVSMSVFADKLELIRSDSRATVASNGVLGDQLVSINPGIAQPIPPGGRIQSAPGLYEDIQLVRARFDDLTDKVDSSLGGISNLFSELNDDRTMTAIKGTLDNIYTVSDKLAYGDGLAGSLLHHEPYKEDFAVALGDVRDTAVRLDGLVRHANKTLANADDGLQPVIDDTRATIADLHEVLAHVQDRDNPALSALLLYDTEGDMMANIEALVVQLEALVDSSAVVAKRVERGKGTLGALVNDPKAYNSLLALLQTLAEDKKLQFAIWWALRSYARSEKQAKRRGE